MAQKVKKLPAIQKIQVWSVGLEDPLEEGMTTHSSILAWRIPWTEEPGGLQSVGLQRVRHYWATKHIQGSLSNRVSGLPEDGKAPGRRRYKNWAYEIGSWKYKPTWRRVLPVSPFSPPPEHSIPHFCSPPWTPFRRCWRSAAAVAHDFSLVEASAHGECPFVVDSELNHIFSEKHPCTAVISWLKKNKWKLEMIQAFPCWLNEAGFQFSCNSAPFCCVATSGAVHWFCRTGYITVVIESKQIWTVSVPFSAICRWVEVTEIYNWIECGVHVTAGVNTTPHQLARQIHDQGVIWLNFQVKKSLGNLFKVAVKLCSALNLL